MQARYDVPEPEGRFTHVAPSPEVRKTLSAVKALPRSMPRAQARQFARNPLPYLNDEAATVLDEAQLDKARHQAGLCPRQLEFIADASDATHAVLRIIDENASVLEEHSFDVQQVKTLLKEAGKARAEGSTVFDLGNNATELNEASEQNLACLSEWVIQRAEEAGQPLTDREIMDLSAFGDRVTGFDTQVQVVPYLKPPDGNQGWLPEIAVVTINPQSKQVQRHQITPAKRDQLARAIMQARACGQPTVSLPGSDVVMPLPMAEKLLDTCHNLDVGSGRTASPGLLKDPKPNKRIGLRIHHNIESLEYVEEARDAMGGAKADDACLPAALREGITLLPYQKEGLAWMQKCHANDRMKGCLLADDMGLGKTLQSLALLAFVRERHHPGDAHRTSLVIVPLVLLENWEEEIRKFLDWPPGAVLTLHGKTLSERRLPKTLIDEKAKQKGVKKLLKADFADGYRLVLTTYETVRDYQLSIAREDWDIVICDEAQKIKNPAALVTQAVKALKAGFRIACTGTPVENSLADLWCLFDFLQPGHLGALNTFTRTYRQPIELRQEGHEEKTDTLRRLIEPQVLRRMKHEVCDQLPRKVTGKEADNHMDALPMSSNQRQAYLEAVKAYRDARRDDGEQSHMLLLLHRLRMICAHPSSSSSGDMLPLKKHASISPKLAWLLECLDRIRAKDEKALVFTTYLDIQRLLQHAIKERFGFRPTIINGSTPVGAGNDVSRQKTIDRFQQTSGFGVLILSTEAVGFGVNIQEANHVIHFTRSWNPAKEDQATDRAYRIGQQRDVYVYCPTVAGSGFESFEQRLASRLEYKRVLAKDILAGEQGLTLDDFKDL